MNHTPQLATSPVFAQIKLPFSDSKPFESLANYGKISTNECRKIMSNLREIPKFHEVKVEPYYGGLELSEIVAMFARKAKSVYERAVLSVRDQEIIGKVNEYEIPYDVRSIDFLFLMEQVEEFDETIEEAARYGIDWKSYGYDLIAIEQEISEAIEAESEYGNYARNEFYANCGV